ncbi:ATP-dependent DNA helicase [Acetivibrio thermocellus]|uniref:ATP-dependent DNA helicase n=1 Tax=Acetivibrio thermocellus TaxID=1515 RepID=UPI0021AD5946|nr:ATP-dependent DNA helicase [Acetivibrio thermocellus]UWV45946.1 ATP-dependent DNA helicase [Acetivibrio thermocellus]
MNEYKKEIKISVRNLVEFVLRTGDIDSSFTGSSRAVEGTRLHKKIQKTQGKEYSPEVFLKTTVEFDDFFLTVEGRADGVINEDGCFIIDEIKTTTAPLELIDEFYNPLHWAQAKCYAYIHALNENLEKIKIRLTYCHLETEEIKYLVSEFDFAELSRFFEELVEKYYVWAKLACDWQVKRDCSIKVLEFPFEKYRKGQRKLAVAVYKTVTEGKKLYVKAPTGIGKTISTLFPAVKAIGEGHASKIFYLTAKTVTGGVAKEAFAKMRQKGLLFKTVTLTAKEKICFMEKAVCKPEKCEYAKGHFDRVNEAIMDILTNEDEIKREVIEEYAKAHRVCPFELALDLTIWADAVICDYNYVFDPRVYLKRFFSDAGGDYIFLVDEAHNLVDRAREMFSAQLSKKSFLKLKKAMKEESPKISKTLQKLNTFMLGMKKLCGDNDYFVSKEEQSEIYLLLRRLIGECEEYLTDRAKNGIENEDLLQLYFDALMYVRIAEFYDDRYVTFVEKSDNDVRIKLFCIDPSHLLSEALKRGKAAVFFSATLLPLSYFKEVLGGGPDDYTMCLDSPFEVNNRCLMIADRISTRYQDRGKSCDEVVQCIKSIVCAKKGNYIAFFPSYQYMNMIYELFEKECGDIKLYVQSSSMTEKEREDFLERFKADPQETVLGFCVLGGIFSEGIDLRDDRLIGAIIVGVGLPQICIERDIIRDYYQNKNRLGFEYSYMYPGMNKVMQAAGRVIRSENDKGVILLIDDRFTNPSYLALFPNEWFPYIRVTGNNISEHVKKFWSRHGA